MHSVHNSPQTVTEFLGFLIFISKQAYRYMLNQYADPVNMRSKCVKTERTEAALHLHVTPQWFGMSSSCIVPSRANGTDS